MSVNIPIKKSIVTRFVVAAYTVTFIIIFIISILYFNQYAQLKESKIVAKTLELIITNSNSLRTLHAVEKDINNSSDNIHLQNESLLKLKEIILTDLSAMALIEYEISDGGIIDHTVSYVANIKPHKKNSEEILQELLIIQEYLREIETTFTLKNNDKVQSILKRDNSFILTVCVLTFFIIIGIIYLVWSYTNRLKISLNNLLKATSEINKQNYQFQAPVFGEDELAKVTLEFNRMTKQLGDHKKEILEIVYLKNKLLAFTNLFSRALTEEEVYDVVFNHAFNFIGAGTGTAYILNQEGDTLLLKKYSGLSKQNIKNWSEIKISQDFPIWDVIKLQKPIFLESSKALGDYSEIDYQLYFTPIIIESRPIGVLTFAYPTNKRLSENEKDFLVSLTNACANAIYRTKLYDNAKKAITVRDDFLSIASHELLTPLTPLKMQMQIYKSKILRNDIENLSTEKMLSFINSSIIQIDKMSLLIDDLLNVSNINSGKLIVHKTRFNLKDFIEKLLMIHSLYTKNALNINILNNTPEDLMVNWDNYKVEQIMLNLFSNANKYAPGHDIEMSVDSDEKCVWIKVRDHGPGIAIKDREKVFKKYERLVNQTNIRGLGLGLYISKEIAQLHDGDLKIIDTEGSGTTFCLTLPINNI